MKWEYRTMSIYTGNAATLDEQMNEFGSVGWEAVQVIREGLDKWLVTFKRLIKD